MDGGAGAASTTMFLLHQRGGRRAWRRSLEVAARWGLGSLCIPKEPLRLVHIRLRQTRQMVVQDDGDADPHFVLLFAASMQHANATPAFLGRI